MKFKLKKKYEKIDVSNEHIFSIDYDGVVKEWKCVVLENEVVTYEDGVEKKHLKIMNKERAPQVLQIDTVTSIYGEMIPFQLENGIPFIKLQGEWISSDTFDVAKRNAAVKMYRRQSKQEAICGAACLLVVLAKQLITGDIDNWWMLGIFGMFFISSAALRIGRLQSELNIIKNAEMEAEKEAAKETETAEIGVKAARAALESASEETK